MKKSLSIFHLLLAEWFANKDIFFICGTMVCIPLCVPLLFVHGTLIDDVTSTQIQIIYAITQVSLLIIAPLWAAGCSFIQRSRNNRIFWEAAGVGQAHYYLSIVAASIISSLSILLICNVLITFFCRHSTISYSSLNQALLLTWLSTLPALPIAIGLAQKISAASSAILTILFNLVCFFIPSVATAAREVPNITQNTKNFWEFIYVVIPQLRIGDQAQRITFSWPAINVTSMFMSCIYLLGWLLITLTIGFLLWKNNSKKNTVSLLAIGIFIFIAFSASQTEKLWEICSWKAPADISFSPPPFPHQKINLFALCGSKSGQIAATVAINLSDRYEHMGITMASPTSFASPIGNYISNIFQEMHPKIHCHASEELLNRFHQDAANSYKPGHLEIEAANKQRDANIRYAYQLDPLNSSAIELLENWNESNDNREGPLKICDHVLSCISIAKGKRLGLPWIEAQTLISKWVILGTPKNLIEPLKLNLQKCLSNGETELENLTQSGHWKSLPEADQREYLESLRKLEAFLLMINKSENKRAIS